MEPYEGREPYIFISYARKDAERVAPYLDALSGADYRVWYDAGISAGDEWLKKLEEKVANCEVFCPIFSQAFNDSYYCFRETSYACWRDKKIVPLYLEEVEESLRLMFRLLKYLQHLRLDDCNPAQFAERLEGQEAFAPCKASEWNKVGQIQWRLNADGFLSIAKNEDLRECYNFPGSISAYQFDPLYKRSTAPWALYREKIFSVEIADDIDEIGGHAFYGCESLTKARVGNGVTKIGRYAFYGCKSLTDIRIPDSVTEIGKNAFGSCESLTNVHIPDSVTTIGDYAFTHCENLTDVRIPDSVTTIGDWAFWACHSLTNVHIPDSVTTIGQTAFEDCDNLKSVEISAMVKVGWNAFPVHTLVTRREVTGKSFIEELFDSGLI